MSHAGLLHPSNRLVNTAEVIRRAESILNKKQLLGKPSSPVV